MTWFADASEVGPQMAQPPAPHPDEQGRLDALLALDVLDTTPEAHFEGLVKLGKCARVIAEPEF